MLVEDIMTIDLVTCPLDASVEDAAEAMLSNRTGSVIVEGEEYPTGIVTETDLIYAGYVAGRPFAEIPVRKIMSQPLVTIDPRKTVLRASHRMSREGLKKLGVARDLELVGIITTEDIIANYSRLRADIHDLERQRRDHVPGTRPDTDVD